MRDDKEIQDDISQLNALGTLVRVYEQIASFRMRKTRESVLENRKFVAEINSVFEEVRQSYAREVKKLAKKRMIGKKDRITFLAHNGKTVSVFLSSNTGLYGDIIRNTFDAFMGEIREGKSEATIVGKYGLSLFLEEAGNTPYTYFDLPDFKVKTEDMIELIKHIVQYEEIHVYYGQFVNVVFQKPDKMTISAEISLEDKNPTVRSSYIFEPTLDKILQFFEKELFASMMDHVVREAQLARLASRVMAMSKAEDNVRKSVSELKQTRMKLAHRLSNRNQLNSTASILVSQSFSGGLAK